MSEFYAENGTSEFLKDKIPYAAATLGAGIGIHHARKKGSILNKSKWGKRLAPLGYAAGAFEAAHLAQGGKVDDRNVSTLVGIMAAPAAGSAFSKWKPIMASHPIASAAATAGGGLAAGTLSMGVLGLLKGNKKKVAAKPKEERKYELKYS